MEQFISGFTTSIGSMATEVLGALGGILPVVLPIVGAVAIVAIGVRLFKKYTGR